MNKRRLILLIPLFLIIILIASVSIYKFVYYEVSYNGSDKGTDASSNNNSSKEHYFVKNEILKLKENVKTTELDKDIYIENIINKTVTKTEYNYFSDDKSISGTIYIGSDKYLYITDEITNVAYRVSTVKFKTMYIKEYNYVNGIYIALISEDNKLYCMELSGNDITKAIVVPAYSMVDEVTNFVNINIKYDVYGDANTTFVLSKDGNIYDVASGIRYNKNTISLYNKLYVFEDNTMTNIWGEQLQNKDGINYKIKNVFYTQGESNFVQKDKIIIITEDDKLIYLDSDIYNTYEFNKKVKDIKFDQNMPYIEGNLEIIFEDNYKVSLRAISNEHFALNKVELDFD